ncbi:MAG: glycosyltransferase family 2 protein [Alphaproteobacteria bacterium]
MPLISVGMPVLNAEKTVGVAIQNLLAQTFQDFELVVCDNASEDSTPKIVEAFAKQDPRVRLVRFEERLDIRLSFKRAFENTSAPYFMFAPADDRWYPEFMEETLEVLQSDPGILACSGKVAFFEEDQFSHISKGTAPLMEDCSKNLVRYLTDPVENARAFSLIRREALINAFPDVTYPGWDFQLIARTMIHGKYFEIDKVLAERDITSLEAYIVQAENSHKYALQKAFPLYRLLTEIRKDKKIPRVPGLYRALINLVWRSHVNYAAYRMPRWFRAIGVYVSVFSTKPNLWSIRDEEAIP